MHKGQADKFHDALRLPRDILAQERVVKICRNRTELAVHNRAKRGVFGGKTAPFVRTSRPFPRANRFCLRRKVIKMLRGKPAGARKPPVPALIRQKHRDFYAVNGAGRVFQHGHGPIKTTRLAGRVAPPDANGLGVHFGPFQPGDGAMIGKDDTVFASVTGTVKFRRGRRGRFVDVLEQAG